MGYTLSVYTNNTFKELFLPSINNADYMLLLERGDFGIGRDIEIKMEVVDDEWYVYPIEHEYILIQNNNKKDSIHCKDKSSFKIKTADNLEFSVVVIESERTIETIGKYDIKNLGKITVGKNSDCDIVYESIGLVSRLHAELYPGADGWYVNDLSLNGVFVGTQRIQKNKKLAFGDCINIFGLHIVFLDDMIAVNASYGNVHINENKLKNAYIPFHFSPPLYSGKIPEKQFYHRSPRNLPVVNKDKLAIEPPPAPKSLAQRPLWMTIGPAFTMAIPMMLGCTMAIIAMQSAGGGRSAFMFTGIVTAISSAIIGVIWGLVNARYAKNEGIKEEANRFEKYSDYLVRIADDLKRMYQENATAYYNMYPSAEECCKYSKNSSQLWNRNATHADFLYHRIGIGDLPFEVEIAAPEIKFSLVADELAERPQLLKESYRTLKNIPVGIDLLKNHLIGIVGDERNHSAIQIARALSVQIAANNCYTDVKMAFIYDGANRGTASEWRFAKWLPHVWSEDKKSRYIASNKNEAGDVFYELTKIIRSRADSDDLHRNDDSIPKPYYILFVESSTLLQGELIAKYIFDGEANYGLTTILLDKSYENLPNSCEYVIENTQNYVGVYSMKGGRQTGNPIAFDSVSLYQAESFARNLLSIEVMEIENGGEIPTSLTFFDMYNVTALEQFKVLERWRKNRTYDSMKALIGRKAGNNDCYLDIHEKYHGPHGLIAGTTGSGKSETLQTYMLSLALNYSPEDVAFFVIDFKGGGMANLFNHLPHMAGQISNLSGNQVRRAMLSIKSENLRRQRIFSEFGVNNINSYTRLLKNQEATEPVPHLFIIIDEFAELKREEPEFMRELISVAQIGRSLGVHLILATQKPSGTVDDNIWSNSKFRLCLRVQDRQDSFDMLHRHDAAYLTNSGRCFLQVGNDEIFELFQSGWSGAIYDENMSNRSDIATMLALTGKAAIVGNRIRFKQKETARNTFLSILAANLLNAKAALQISDSEVINDPVKRSTVAVRAFDTIADTELDYPYSKYNQQRLEEFLVSIVQNFDGNLNSTVQRITSLSREGNLKLPEYKDKTQLNAIVEYIDDVARSNKYKCDITLWLPILPEQLYLEQLEGYEKFNGKWDKHQTDYHLNAVIGLCDDPENQAQFPVVIDFAENGNHAVCGSVVSGKSTFLLSAIYALINKYSPEELNIYALDFSSRLFSAFEDCAHVGGVMFENDIDRIAKFFNMIERELAARKELLSGGSFSQYVKTQGNKIPSIVIVVDNYAGFREKTNNAYDDFMMTISRDGVNYGIYLFLSSAGFGTSEIPTRLADNIRTVYCLEMGDKFKYADILHTMRIEILPEADVKGRGLVNIGGSILEFQTALPLEANDDYDRIERIKSSCQKMNACWHGKTAKRIPEIPEHPVWSEFVELDEYRTALERNMLPFGYNSSDASVYAIHLATTYCYVVAGKARSGKTNCLKNMIKAAASSDSDICVVDYGTKELESVARDANAKYVETPREMFDYWNYLLPIFKQRNQTKRQLVEQGMDDADIFARMSREKRIFVFIDDLAKFISSAYKTQDGIGATNGFLENILEKGSLHNIFFIGCIDSDETASVNAYNLFHIITSYKTGIHFGGNVFRQKLFDFTGLSFNEQNKNYKAGIGLVSNVEDSTIVKVVVPDTRR